MAAKRGQAMAYAVANMNIGYDQGERNTILPSARAAAWVLKRIAQVCECDCSSLAGVCGIAAGASESAIYSGENLCYTGNIVSRFKATELVSCYTGADYVKSTAKWRVGDILVSNSHVVVVVSGQAPNGSGSAVAVSGSIVAGYSRGEKIYSIAADTDEADGHVWAHYTAFSGATRYVAVGTADGSVKYLVKC